MDLKVNRWMAFTDERDDPEGGEPLRKVAVVAVIANPYAGRYVADLDPLIRASAGLGERMAEKLRDHRETSPILTGGDVDADWTEADDVGEEAVGGGNPTPDQSVVEDLGEAMGVTFQDNEPLDFTEKLEKRDRDRWELNSSSAEDFEP